MTQIVYDIRTAGHTVLRDDDPALSWESAVHVAEGGAVTYEFAQVGCLRVTRARSTGTTQFRRTHKGVRTRDARFINFIFAKGGSAAVRTASDETLIGADTFSAVSTKAAYTATMQPVANSMELFSVYVPKFQLSHLMDNTLSLFSSDDQNEFSKIWQILCIIFDSFEIIDQNELYLFSDLLMNNFRRLLQEEADGEPKISASSRISRVEQFITDNAADPALGAGLIAKGLNISVRLLSSIVSERGTNLRSLINAARIRLAKEVLRVHPAISIKEVSEITGFRSPAHFSQVFRKETGSTPASYGAQIAAQQQKA